MPLYRFLSYWLADRTRALILFSSFLVPVSLRVCAYVCVLGLRAVATCFVKIRTIFRGASGDVLHLRDVHASLIRARVSLFVLVRSFTTFHSFANYPRIPCITYDRDMYIEIASNDHETWHYSHQLIRSRMVFNLDIGWPRWLVLIHRYFCFINTGKRVNTGEVVLRIILGPPSR